MRIFLCVSVVMAMAHLCPGQNFLSWKYNDRYFSLSAGTGLATYMGDIDTFRPSVGLQAFNLGLEARLLTHFSARIEGNYYQLSADDANAPEGSFERQRNLSFVSDNWEANLQVVYYIRPYNDDYFSRWQWDPYIAAGVGVTTYHPYTELQGEKYFLREIPTEPGKDYGHVAMIIPVSAGIKFKVSDFVNINFEVGYRHTNTDYLDDVSTTYPTTYPNFTVEQLSNRKDEIPLVNAEAYDQLVSGAQRGDNKKRDTYILGLLKVEVYLPNQLFSKKGRKVKQYRPK